MPTFKTYVEEDGYYILARPSNIGNVTYQITPSATAFVLELGYEDADDLPWGLVSPLKDAGHVFTNQQGVGDTLDGVDLQADLLPALDDEEAHRLLKYLESESDTPDETLDQLRNHVNENMTSTSSGDSPSSSGITVEDFSQGLSGNDPQPSLQPPYGDLEERIETAVAAQLNTNDSIDVTMSRNENFGISYDIDIILPAVTVNAEDGPVRLTMNFQEIINEWVLHNGGDSSLRTLAATAETKAAVLRALASIELPIDLKTEMDDDYTFV